MPRKAGLGWFLFLIGWLMVVVACSPRAPVPETVDPVPRNLPLSVKGYALYSWRARGAWYFTLITGTDRVKTVEEITEGQNLIDPAGWVKLSVKGADAVKELLEGLGAGDTVMWVGPQWWQEVTGARSPFALPDQQVIDDLVQHAAMKGLVLEVTE